MEIVRILIRSRKAIDVEAEVKRLEFDHQTFAIPLFILPQEEIDENDAVDLAIGYIDQGEALRVYKYFENKKQVDEVTKSEEKKALEKIFMRLIEHPKLISAEEFINEFNLS